MLVNDLAKKGFLIIGAIGLLTGLHGQKDSLVWSEFIPMDGHFRVTAPGNFKQYTDTIETKIGEMVYHTYLGQAEPEIPVFMVSYVDYPEGVVHPDSTELIKSLFDASMEEAAFSVNGQVIYSDDLTMDVYPGRLWRINYKSGKASIKTKAYLVGNRFYNVQVVLAKGKSLNPAADRFLDSFRVFRR